MNNNYPLTNMYTGSIPNYIIEIIERLNRIESKIDTLEEKLKAKEQ